MQDPVLTPRKINYCLCILETSPSLRARITQGAGRLSELERMCAAGAEDSDCDDGDDPNDPIRKGTELEGSAASDPSAVNGGMSSKSSSFRAAGRASGGARSVNSVTFSDNVGHDGGRRSDGASPPGGARGSESGSIGGDIEDDSVGYYSMPLDSENPFWNLFGSWSWRAGSFESKMFSLEES